GATVWRPDGRYGNALLAKRRILSIRHHDLSYPGHQPRAAIDAQVDIDGQSTARVLVTHFGLGLAERRYQLRKLLELLDHDHSRYTLLLADINEWLPGSVVIRRLNATLGRSSSRRTFPSRWPLFPLDRIWMRPKDILLETSVSDTFLGRTASDHLPLRAIMALPEVAVNLVKPTISRVVVQFGQDLALVRDDRSFNVSFRAGHEKSFFDLEYGVFY